MPAHISVRALYAQKKTPLQVSFFSGGAYRTALFYKKALSVKVFLTFAAVALLPLLTLKLYRLR
jgi:hypothetical protein